MTSTELQQDDAGNGYILGSTLKLAKKPVNLFLPGYARVFSAMTVRAQLTSWSRHHQIESVHFTASDGRPLHPALASIQTLAREYYVLRDNAMQVGSEEDGVAEVWRRVLGCDWNGILVEN